MAPKLSTQIPSWRRIRDPEQIRRLHSITFPLSALEIWWRDRQPFLQSRGYILRPRFHPLWRPSWLGTDLIPSFCEDSFSSLNTSKMLDATSARDGRRVAIITVRAASSEHRLVQRVRMLQQHGQLNHCVQILDEFTNPSEPNMVFVVMPLLLPFDTPPFSAVGEVVQFIMQTLQGLASLHRHGIAHRDCGVGNIMMDGDVLFPQGFHPVNSEVDPTGNIRTRPLKRIDVASRVKYYFIDFGISVACPDPSRPEGRMITSTSGQDRDVPEFRNRAPFDAYPADVFILGNVYRKTFLLKYRNLGFIQSLVDAMTNPNPRLRPSASGAFDIIAGVSALLASREPLLMYGQPSPTPSASRCWPC